MARIWSGPEIEYLIRHLGEPVTDTAKSFSLEFPDIDRSYDSIQKKVNRLRSTICDISQEEDNDSINELIAQPIEPKIPHVTAAEKRAARKDAEEWLKSIIEFSRRETADTFPQKPDKVQSNNSSLVIVLSDLHFGKLTDKFNLEVARQRLNNIPKQLKTTTLPPIDEVVIVLLGDIVEGEDIYANQNSKVECPVFEQTQKAVTACWETILLFRKLFKCKIRVETAPGNHGRMSKTANEKTNWDNVVYYILGIIAHMHGDKDIYIDVCFNKLNTFNIRDKRIGIHHRGVKHAGTPAMREKIAGWALKRDIDLFIHGHWHEWHIGNWQDKIVVSNGSLCGPDDLGEDMAREDNARQAWFLVESGKPAWGFSFIEWEAE